MPKFTLKVTMEFDKDDIETILDDVNEFNLNDDSKPITWKEFKKSKKLQNYVAQELAGCNGEIVEGSREAIVNDWLCDIEDYR